MAWRRLVCVVALWGAGCSTPAGTLGVDLTLVFDTSVSDFRLASADRLAFTVMGDEAATFELGLVRPLEREERLVYRPAGSSRHITLAIAALAKGELLANGSTPELTLPERGEIAATVTLRGDADDADLSTPLDGGALDLPPPPDGSSPTCNNGVVDSDETAQDCGGSCLYCAGTACASDGDCTSGRCDGVCVPASGPPFWLDGPILPSARAYLAAAQRTDGAAVIAGGTNNGSASGAMNDVLVLDSPGGSLVASAPMGFARCSFAMAADGAGNVYAMGGQNMIDGDLASVELFNGSGWFSKPSMLNLHSRVGAARMDDNHILVADSSGNEALNLASGIWTAADTFIGSRDGAGVVRGSDGKVYEIGGYSSDAGSESKLVNVYLPSSDSWSGRASLAQKRQLLGAALAPDGRIYAVGGFSGVALDTVEAYQSNADRWSSKVDQLPGPRWAHAVTIGPDNRVYAFGGFDMASTVMASSVAYGPIVTVPSAAVQAGGVVQVTLKNFAASAHGQVKLDDTIVASFTTDASGAAAASFVLPSGLTPQHHRVSARDSKSLYPALTALLVN